MDTFPEVTVIVTVVCATIAAVTDFAKGKVYNVLTIPLAVSGVAYHSLIYGAEGFLHSSLGIVVGFALLFLPFAMGGMGGGDLKLLAGIGAWVGVPGILYVFIPAGLLAGVCAILMLLWQKRSLGRLAGDLQMMWYQFCTVGQQTATDDWVDHSITKNKPRRGVIPFAVLVALAVIINFLYATWLGAQG